MSNPTYKPSEGKREEFRKYLEKNGVLDALTKVLVNLYEEVDKPEDALQYIRDKLALQAGLETYCQMVTKYEEALNQVKDLEAQIEQLKITQAENAAAIADEPKPEEPVAAVPSAAEEEKPVVLENQSPELQEPPETQSAEASPAPPPEEENQ